MHSVRDSLYARHATADENIRYDELSRGWCASRPNQMESNDFGRDSIFEVTARSIPVPRSRIFDNVDGYDKERRTRIKQGKCISRCKLEIDLEKKKNDSTVIALVTVVIQHNSW